MNPSGMIIGSETASKVCGSCFTSASGFRSKKGRNSKFSSNSTSVST